MDYADELTRAERQRHEAGAAADARYPAIRYGKLGQVQVLRCSKCEARREGISEAEAITRAAQQNKGAGSIEHTKKRIEKFRNGMLELKHSLAVLVGFAVSDDGGLALRQATRPTDAGLDPDSAGAPPGTAEVAAEVGRPKAGDAPGQPCAPNPPEDPDWHKVGEPQPWSPTDGAPVGEAAGSYYDVHSMENLGLNASTLRRLGKCYAFAEYEGLRSLFKGAFGAILHKKEDMHAAAQTSEGIERWLHSLRGEVPSAAASTVEGSDAASDVASVSAAS